MTKNFKVPGKVVKVLTFAQAAPANNPIPSAPTSSRQSAPPSSLAPPSDPGSPLSDMTERDADGSSDGDGGGVTTPKIACPKGLTRQTLKQHKEFVHKGNEDNRDKQIDEVHKLAKKHLNLKTTLSYQDTAMVKRVFHAMKAKFPDLKHYTQNWPAKCLFQAHLKVTSDAAKNAIVANFKKEVSVKPSRRAAQGRD
ncbi:hypothetical protein DFH07DRAFT_784682 [Mycena maculata]|uniref:Uncharacterized protein n=1 Tax=Mycena maculata TaxID=230809 RepID=A0AAD7MIN8_9AGAR|nr:hypothetical protein DFH07DRAFT_784682 [Mycena maculata]